MHALNEAPSADAVAASLALARPGVAVLPLSELMGAANALRERGEIEAAAQLYADWIAHSDSPLRHVACFNRGTLLALLGHYDEVELAYRQALAFEPNFPQAHLNLGHQLERRGRFDEALQHWHHVARLDPPAELPTRLHALNNCARLLETLRRYPEADAFMRASLALKPDQGDVLQHFVHLRQKQCQWPLYAPVAPCTANQLLTGTSALAMLSASDDPALQLMAAQRFVHERVPKYAGTPLHLGGPARSGKLRIGYLSGDLCLHAVGILTVELLELHDRERFEVFGFCWSRDDGSPLRRRIVEALDHHVRLADLDDEAAARLIAQLGIDVLVDLQGLTQGARPAILARRPAPVQVSYLGFPGCSGLPGVDWIVADPYVMPAELLPFHTEQPLYVPHCYQVSDRQRAIGPRPTRAAAGLPEDAFVYCSFNNNFKFTEEVFQLWMRVLRQVPHSVLWLLADNEWARDNMLREADAAGVARERLVFAPRVAPDAYLARFQLADLVLDTFPYNAGTTASDVLWVGTPILTRSGRSYISRMAGSLLHAVGLPELAVDSAAAYEQMAVLLGRQPQRIASYKRYLAEEGRRSRLFDVPARVRDLEHAFAREALRHRPAQSPPG
ncbi:MAG TPA: tetratricopeptide repeat protein [Ideonella sp.]|nr:tetratricopeptide repeat protein [Ideonella sp.]